MNIAPRELSDGGLERVERVQRESGLLAEIIREHGAIGVDLLKRVRDSIVDTLRNSADDLIWTQYPSKDQRVAVAELALMVAHSKRDATGLHTPKQVGWAWSMLSQYESLADFLEWFVSTFSADDPSDGVDRAFQFLQACEFSFPRTLVAVESIVNHVSTSGLAKYGHYISELEQWFRPAWMKQLDESGIPLPLAEKLKPHLRQPQSKAEALFRIQSLDLNRIPAIGTVDRFILKLALR
jgi:hypothetical protein